MGFSDPLHFFPTRRSSDLNDLKAPAELTMLAKTLLHLDAITKKLDPDYDPQRVIRDYAEDLIAQKLKQKFRSEEHTSELQSPCNLVCRILLEKKKNKSREN